MQTLKIIIVLFISCCLLFANTSIISADYNELKIEYSQKLAAYNTSYSDFQIAKSSYLTYKTLSALTKALDKAKDYLVKRDELIIKHFELLKEKGATRLADDEITFYQNHLTLVPAIANLKDAETVAKKAEDQIILSNVKSKQILGQILIAKVQAIGDSYSALINDSDGLEAKIVELKKSGNNTDKLERWLVEVKNKKILCETVLAQVSDKLNSLKAKAGDLEKDFNEARIDISQANLYLKEGANYIREILEEMKYQ